MKDAFPQLKSYLGKVVSFQRVQLGEDELENARVNDREAVEFYEKALACQNENMNVNVKCLMNVISKSGCRREFEQLIKCSKYLTDRFTPDEEKVVGLCDKQDYNLRNCLEEITFPILQSISDLPLKA